MIRAALAAVRGIRYLEVLPPGDGQCAIYQAGQADWPAPGPNYVRVGTSGPAGVADGFSLGPGLPLYARHDADPRSISAAISLTRGTRTSATTLQTIAPTAALEQMRRDRDARQQALDAALAELAQCRKGQSR